MINVVTFELIPEDQYEPYKEMLLDMDSDIAYSRQYVFLGI